MDYLRQRQSPDDRCVPEVGFRLRLHCRLVWPMCQALLVAFFGFAGSLALPSPAMAQQSPTSPATTRAGSTNATDAAVPDAGSVNRSLGGGSAVSADAARGSLRTGSTSLFGLTGEGNSFVYVLDRSGSMGGSGRVALAAAKVELVASLESLDRAQRFQIIFYNQTPVIFNPTARPGSLAFATDANKENARRFVGSISADGGTRHEDALKLAIRLRPDVIFFLTDAGQPQLKPQQLEQIRGWAAGIKINVIEFGQGPKPDGDNFLTALARQNDGQYTYVDISSAYHGPRT
jgi:hypothetical protein